MLGVKVIFDLDNSLIKTEDYNDYSTGYSFSGDLNVVIQITGPGGAVHSGGTSSSPDKTISSSDYTPGSTIGTSRKFQVTMPSTLSGGWKIDYLIYDQAGSGSVYTEYYAFTYSFSVPTGSVSLTATPSSSLLTSIDSTNYNSSYTNNSAVRTHSIYPAPGAVDPLGVAIPSPADSGSSATITYTGITTGVWTSDISTLCEWQDGATVSGSTTNTSLHYVTGTVAGGSSATIDSDVGLCDVYCCLKALNDRYEQAKCKNKELAEDYKAKIEDVTRLVTLYVQAISCGLTADASCYVTDIKNISECGTECSCYGSSDVPANIPIVSSTSSNSFKIQSASERLTMTTSGSGTSADPVVYKMDLGATISGDINYTTQNIHDVNSRLGILEKEVEQINQDVQATLDSPERLTMTINHYFSQSSVSIVKNQNFIVGRRFYPTTDILVSAQNITDSNFKNKNNVIHVTNFQNSTWQRQSFYAEGRVINNSEVDVEIYWIDPADDNGYGLFKYRFLDKIDRYVLSNGQLAEYPNIQISIDLISGKLRE